MLIRIRNNSESLRTLPAVGDVNGKLKGPIDRINLAPGATVEIDDERLKLYDSPAFNAAFEDRDDGRKPDLEILGPVETARSVSERLADLTSDPSAQIPPAPLTALDLVNG